MDLLLDLLLELVLELLLVLLLLLLLYVPYHVHIDGCEALPLYLRNLRELVLVHDRNPESMRTVPRVCAAGRDSVSAKSGDLADESPFFRKFGPGPENRSKP